MPRSCLCICAAFQVVDMSNFVDLHHHLIYGMDDGARSLEDMQKMILRAEQEGGGGPAASAGVVVPGGVGFRAGGRVDAG